MWLWALPVKAVKATADGRSVSIADAVTGAVNAAAASTAGRVTREASHVGGIEVSSLTAKRACEAGETVVSAADLRKLLRA